MDSLLFFFGARKESPAHAEMAASILSWEAICGEAPDLKLLSEEEGFFEDSIVLRAVGSWEGDRRCAVFALRIPKRPFRWRPSSRDPVESVFSGLSFSSEVAGCEPVLSLARSDDLIPERSALRFHRPPLNFLPWATYRVRVR